MIVCCVKSNDRGVYIVNIKSKTFDFICIVIFLVLALYTYKTNNPNLFMIFFILYSCYSIYKLIVEKKYKTTWLIVICYIISSAIICIFFYFLKNPVNPSNNSELIKRYTIENYTKLALFLTILLSTVFRMNKFKK
jgi:hypothetical protein